jgi:hypothetical protein
MKDRAEHAKTVVAVQYPLRRNSDAFFGRLSRQFQAVLSGKAPGTVYHPLRTCSEPHEVAMRICLLAAFIFVEAMMGSARAADLKSCILTVVQTDLGAKTAFQNGLRDLIAAEAPQFADLARINRDLQVQLAQSGQQRLHYLLNTAPDRLQTGSSLSQLMNFDWSETDDANLAAADSGYADLKATIENLTKQNNGHPDWPALRTAIKGELGQLPRYSALIAEIQAQREQANHTLDGCRRQP